MHRHFSGTTVNNLAITGGLIGGIGLVNNSPFAINGGWQLITTASTTNAGFALSSIIISAANAAILPGQLIIGLGIPNGTFITNVNGTTLTTNQNVNIAGAITFVSFYMYNGNSGDESIQGLQFSGSYNNGYYSRLKKYIDVSNGTIQNIYGPSGNTGQSASTIMTETQIAQEFKPYTKVVGNYIITYDIAIIRLCDIFDSMKNLCLMKKFNGILRLYFNTGSVGSAIQAPGYMITSGSVTTFTNTCPIIQSCLTEIPATSAGIVTGLFVGKATATNVFGGVNLANSNASHPLTSCRIYYPQVTLKPQHLLSYISENRAKKICYTDVLFNTFNNITSGATSSFLVQSGVTNIRGVVIIPFISTSTYGYVNTGAATGCTTFSQLQSPFDTAPATNGPISLTNIQVAIGGVNQLQNVLNYGYENFIEQVSLYEKINQSDLGLSCGLLNEFYWSNAYRVYYVDCSRANVADLMTPRNVNVSFLNNTNVTIDVMIFVEYFTEMIVDVETGMVSK